MPSAGKKSSNKGGEGLVEQPSSEQTTPAQGKNMKEGEWCLKIGGNESCFTSVQEETEKEK